MLFRSHSFFLNISICPYLLIYPLNLFLIFYFSKSNPSHGCQHIVIASSGQQGREHALSLSPPVRRPCRLFSSQLSQLKSLLSLPFNSIRFPKKCRTLTFNSPDAALKLSVVFWNKIRLKIFIILTFATHVKFSLILLL